MKNERIAEGEFTQEQTGRKYIALDLKHCCSALFEQLVLQLDAYPRPHHFPKLHGMSFEIHGKAENFQHM